jgi:hypothetical protein
MICLALTPSKQATVDAGVRNAGHVITNQQLLAAVWGIRCGTPQQYLHVFMAAYGTSSSKNPHVLACYSRSPAWAIACTPVDNNPSELH